MLVSLVGNESIHSVCLLSVIVVLEQLISVWSPRKDAERE